MIDLSIHKKLWSPEGEMILELDTTIKKGSFLTFYGKSGAGKTSALRIISGLMAPEKGKIIVNGKTWFDSSLRINLSPQQRKVGFLFQDYALFPNMTVKENLLFSLVSGQPLEIINELIDIMELGELLKLKPQTLSGGQKQRVALARSLVQKPEILLLDEPLSALDNEMRIKLQPYILQLHKEYNLSTILVSHDTSEIFKLSDIMIVLEKGKIIRSGSPAEVFTHKKVSGKFQFIGELIKIEKQDFIYILSILIGQELVKVVADESEVGSLSPGDRLLVASKAFNPIIRKLS